MVWNKDLKGEKKALDGEHKAVPGIVFGCYGYYVWVPKRVK